MTKPSHTIDDLIALAQEQDALILPEGWGQGRATFGGVVAALLYSAMARKVDPERPVRSLSISFIGPVAPGAVQITTEVLREGRGITQVEGRMLQNGQVQAVMLGSFGASRESAAVYRAEPGPALQAPETCEPLPYIPNLVPEFTQALNFGWAVGGMPFSGNPSREMGGWVQFKQAKGPLTAAHILGLVDAWPPAVLPILTMPAPASTVSWTVEFLQPIPAAAANDWFAYVASVDHAQDGYGHVQSRLWTASGELVALSRQTVVVFA